MVRCGQCNKEFKDRKAYLKHICEVTGVDPTDPKSMGANYKAIQEAALKRGSEQK